MKNGMKTAVLASILIASGLASVSAKADGFKCEAVDGSIRAKIFNHTTPEKGTRVGAILVLSDPSVEFGNKTIATFKEVKGTLTQNSGTRYYAEVTPQLAKGEYIMGTRLGELQQVALIIDFSYFEPVAPGSIVTGTLNALKKNGQTRQIDMECSRYLKN